MQRACLRLQKRLLSKRTFATAAAASHDPSKIRNMALVAHIDSGKTTLTESILLTSHYLSHSGSVDTGSTTTDFLPAERERGITIQSASIPVKWKDWTFNLIDTPGHADFGMEVESASRIVDGAVVLIDSVEGVEAQTKGVWKQLDRYGVATRLVFLNKLDRTGASFRSSIASLLAHRMHPNPLPITLPVASFEPADYNHAEPGIHGLVDILKWEIWRWDEHNNAKREALPRDVHSIKDVLPSNHPMVSHLPAARTQLLENLSMFSEDLMETLLSSSSDGAYLDIDSSRILPHLRKASLENNVLPVVCGSAIRHVGTDILMDYVGELFASPLDVPHEQAKNAPLRLLAWKVSWDKRKGWMTFVRVYSGTLKRQSSLLNVNSGAKEKVNKLLLLYASEAQEVDELPFGSVGVILGLKYTRTGDTLVAPGTPASSRSAMSDIVPPPAVISASIIPNSHADHFPVQEALESLSRTDPSVRVDTQEGQLLIHGLGALHLEIVEGRLRDEFSARFEIGKRRVNYRESLSPSATIKPSDQFADAVDIAGVSTFVGLDIRALREDEEGHPLWDGNVVVDQRGNTILPPERPSGSPESFIAAGIASTLSSSPNSSLPMSGIHITVDKYTSLDSSAWTILTGAAAKILRNKLQEVGLGPVMEPYFLFKVSVTEEHLGKVMKDLTEHGAELQDLGDGATGTEELGGYPEDGLYMPPGWLSPSGDGTHTLKGSSGSSRIKRSIHAIAPLSRMLDYNTRLRAVSGGHGQFEMSNAGFRIVSQARRMEILREIGRA